MRIEVIRCDQCKKEHDAQYVPIDWIRTIQINKHQIEEEHHFCSLDCLFNWTADAMMEKKGEGKR